MNFKPFTIIFNCYFEIKDKIMSLELEFLHSWDIVTDTSFTQAQKKHMQSE